MATKSTTPILELKNINKSFGPIEVLNDISLQVRAGEVLCLLGDNGAGKSTLIKLMSGVYIPTSGQIEMDGKPVAFQNPRDASGASIRWHFSLDEYWPQFLCWR
jgi:simple sugar transport system ATP-binding protein